MEMDANTTDIGAGETEFDTISEQMAGALSIYYTPVLVVLGSIGNFISIFVFFTSRLRYQSTSQYLSALAMSDNLFLLQLVPPWLNSVKATKLFNRYGFCQVFMYISYVACTLSAWLVAAFTVERFVAVLFPLRRTILCTVRRARYSIAVIAVAAIIINIPVLRLVISTENNCSVDHNFLDNAARFNFVDTVISFTVPLAMIIILNTCIMCRLRSSLFNLVEVERQVNVARRMPPAVGFPRSQHRVTKMLLIVSSVFVLLNMPGYTMRILAYALDIGDGETNSRWAAMQQLALLCFHSNFGVNFILYCLSGQNFRKELQQAIPKFRRGRPEPAVRRVNSPHPNRANIVGTEMVSFTDPVASSGRATMTTTALTTAGGPRRVQRKNSIRQYAVDNRRQLQQRAQALLDTEQAVAPTEMQEFAGPSV